MNKDNINISKVESFLNTLLDNKVSNNTFFGKLLEKETIPSDWTDMILVEMPNGIYDKDAYGQGTALIHLYARPLSTGRKNVATMNQLEQKLNIAVAENANTKYSVRRRQTYTYYDNDINWHCNIVELEIVIV